MRIISKFNDYYDSAMAYGTDDHVVWLRKEEEIKISPSEKHNIYYGPDKNLHPFFYTDVYRFSFSDLSRYLTYHDGRQTPTKSIYDRDINFIGFCGKIYTVATFKWNMPYEEEDQIEHAYSVEDIQRILLKIDKRGKLSEKFNEPIKKKRSRWKPWRANNHSDFQVDKLTKYYNEHQGADYIDPFIEHKVPVLMFTKGQRSGEDVLTLNPTLKDFGFQKVMDPFAAYQEIEMFMSGVLGLNDPETVHIDDKHMAQQKGFDEWSFKKLPTKKR